MFYHLEGTVSELGPNLAVLDCGGLGFALNVTTNTLSRLKNGQRAKLYVSESIGETNFDLFGFFGFFFIRITFAHRQNMKCR